MIQLSFSVAGKQIPLEIMWKDGERVYCRTPRTDADPTRREMMAVLCAAPPPSAGLDRLTHEYSLKDYLDPAWAVRPLELLRDRGQRVLVLESFGGEPLARMIGPPMELGKFLRLAVSLSAALGQLHGRGLIHKDIRPTNILIDPVSGQIKLTGFGISSHRSHKLHLPEPPALIAGTLPYTAPEQTGRMNRSSDSRSDLYSLGVTLYHALTGCLPFAAIDALEWVYCHMAMTAAAPRERLPSIPQPVSEIIMKLLAKSPDERYQTAAGVESDFRKCLAAWLGWGRIDTFAVGANDVADRAAIFQGFEGRDAQTAVLQAVVTRAAATTIDSAPAHLDAAAIVKAAQALSSGLQHPALVEKLVRVALEHAGADRGLLIRMSDSGLLVEAQARAGRAGPAVAARHAPVTALDLPLSVLQRVLRTRRRVLLDDASARIPDSDDEYLRRTRPRSVLCLPILNETQVIGALYLENSLTARAFTEDRLALLEVLASQAMISLENARLRGQISRAEASFAEAQRLSSSGSFHWRVSTDEISCSKQVHCILGVDPAAALTLEQIRLRLHADDLPSLRQMIERARSDGSDVDCKLRLRMPDGSLKYIHLAARAARDPQGGCDYIGAVRDVTDSQVSEEALGRARSELAHVARVSSLGTLAASIAHEINQPLTGIINNANACARMLDADPPNLNGARETARRIVRDTGRASEVVARLRALFAKRAPTPEIVDLNEAAREVIALSAGELQKAGVILRQEYAERLPPVSGDRVQLQQVVLNLLLNGADAMRAVNERPRQLIIKTQSSGSDYVCLSVQDAGVGFEPQLLSELFEPFYTTKPGGMGIGLSVSRSIIESHHGRLTATLNDGPGATFSVASPRAADVPRAAE